MKDLKMIHLTKNKNKKKDLSNHIWSEWDNPQQLMGLKWICNKDSVRTSLEKTCVSLQHNSTYSILSVSET